MYRNWRDLIKPREVVIDPRSKSDTYAKFICEPLERGYGNTVGNALRRILLNSIMGAAVTRVKIEGALHEFTSLPEVKEDVTDIVLNLKELRLKLHEDEERIVTIDVEGPATVTAPTSPPAGASRSSTPSTSSPPSARTAACAWRCTSPSAAATSRPRRTSTKRTRSGSSPSTPL